MLGTFLGEGGEGTFFLGVCHGTRPNEHNTQAVDDTHKSRSVDQSVWTCVIRYCSPSLRAQNKCVYGTSVCMHSQHGSRAVNLVVSREFDGAVRAPGTRWSQACQEKTWWQVCCRDRSSDRARVLETNMHGG